MGYLSDIAKEVRRLENLGLKPIEIRASQSVIDGILKEYEGFLFKETSERTRILGLDTRVSIDIKEGEFRIMTEW